MSASAPSARQTGSAAAAQPASASEAKQANPTLEEDDEFEDFPVEDWSPADTELPGATSSNAQPTGSAARGEVSEHLWEESWDDDDTNEEFSTQLREELKKVQQTKNT